MLEHVREGKTNAEIAVRIGVSPETVKYHVSNMLAKLGLEDRRELARWKPGRQRVLGRWWGFGVPAILREVAVAGAIVAGVGATFLGAAWLVMGTGEEVDPADDDPVEEAVEDPTDDMEFPGRLLFVQGEGWGTEHPQSRLYVVNPSTGDFAENRALNGQWGATLSPDGRLVAGAVPFMPALELSEWIGGLFRMAVGPAEPPFPAIDERPELYAADPVHEYLRERLVVDQESGRLDVALMPVAQWHPDGERVIFAGASSVMQSSERPNGTDGVMSITRENRLTVLGFDCYYPAWFEDGERGVCVHIDAGDFALLVGEVDEHFAGDLAPLIVDSEPPFEGFDLHPEPSPDGRYVAWWRLPVDDGEAPRLFAADLGSDPAIVHDLGPGMHPRWAPDGEQLVAVDPSGATGNVVLIEAGTWEREFFHGSGADDYAPTWSPDGEYIAFVSERERAGGDIFISPRDASMLHRLELHYLYTGQTQRGGESAIQWLDWGVMPEGSSWP